MKAEDIKREFQRQDQAATKAAMEKAIAKSHVEWFERQSMVINRLVELLPHPGVQPGSMEHFEHRLKALCFACFGLAARYQVEFDQLMAYGKHYYDAAKEQLATLSEAHKSTSPEVSSEQVLTEDRNSDRDSRDSATNELLNSGV